MDLQFDHSVIMSFKYWLDDYLLAQNAYEVKTGQFYPQQTKIGSSYVYSAPTAQFVDNSDAVGAEIPSGAYINQTWVPRGTSGVKIDFVNGRVYTDIAGATITGTYTQKDFNLYLGNQFEDSEVFLDEAFNGKEIFTVESGSTPGRYVAPCILISPGIGENKPFAIGGTDETNVPLSLMVITDDYYKAVGAQSILRDSAYKCFTRVPVEDEPYTIYGDLKESGYSYDAWASNKGVDTLFIDRVRTFPIKKSINQRRDFYVYLVEMDIKDYRLT